MDAQRKNSSPVPQGILVIIGGHEEKENFKKQKNGTLHHEDILRTFIQLTGKKQPRIEVVTTASEAAVSSFDDYKKAFSELGIEQLGHIHHDRRSELLADNLSSRIQQADAIFFTGGDQLKLTSLYGGSALLLQLKQRYIYDKIVIGGTSAGAMAFSTPMIFAGNKERQQFAGAVRMTTGLEFLKDICVDTHFVDRSRFVRMSQVIASNPTNLGIGIEEHTAVIVRRGTSLSVIGNGVVFIIEGYGITSSNILEYGSGKAVSIHNLNVRILADGEDYQISQCNPPHI